MVKKLVSAAVAVCLVSLAGASFAGGGGMSIVYDPTNYVQNLISANNAVREVANGVEQIRAQYMQYNTMVRQLQSVNSETLLKNAQTMLRGTDLPTLNAVLSATSALSTNITRIEHSFRGRLDESRMLRMPWNQYLAREEQRLQRSEEAAISRVKAEKHAMERIERDYEFIRDQADRIPASAGMHESMQQLNVQVNRMLQQNAEILRAVALANGSQAAEKQLQEVEAQARNKAAAQRVRETVESTESGGRSSFQNWLNSNSSQNH